MFIHSLLYVEILRTCDSANGSFRNALKHVVSSYNNFLRTKRFVLKKVVPRAYEQKEGKNIIVDVTQRSICLIYSICLKVYQNKRVNMATFKDETLTELVRKYKVLYDKAHPECHRKDIKNNAWKEVAEA